MKEALRKFLYYSFAALGFRTNRKIIVIESDDWGTVRTSSIKAYSHLLKKGYKVDECVYNKFDCLESDADLELLFEVLHAVKDKYGNPTVITANNIIANPDFNKIRSSRFTQYFYEPFTRTLRRYPNSNNVLNLYREGVGHKVFFPQFHGREHVNVNRWLADLRYGKKSLLDAFEFEMFTLHESGISNARQEYLDAFGWGYSQEDEVEDLTSIVNSGFQLFEDIWGYKSKSFIAPTYTWPPILEDLVKRNGVSFLQGNFVQKIPIEGKAIAFKKKYHFLGQRNNLNQIYLTRNVMFEPVDNNKDNEECIRRALSEIEFAFKWRKPAIISSHRVNYIGSLSPSNRDNNLKLLLTLLRKIKNKWPEIEFMTTEQVGNLILNS